MQKPAEKSVHGHGRRLVERPPRVLLVFPTANMILRQIFNGILRYAHQHGPWEFHLITDMMGEQGLSRTREWGCTGAIAMVETRARANAVLAAGVPVVFFNPPRSLLKPGSPVARCSRAVRDQLGLGRVGADYFIDRHYENFAFVGDVYEPQWSVGRGRGFAERVTERGFACHMYPSLPRRERLDFGLEQKRLKAWLRELPKPVALMAAWDRRGRQVLDCCLEEGIPVPRQIALLGVDNDEILCETTTPSLSSIAFDGENNGYDIARLLDEQLRSARPRRPRVLSLGILNVVTRQSTDTSRVADPLMARALDFIQANIGAPVTVADVARHLRISKRLLEMKSQQALGRTMRDEIQRVRLERARSLLRNSRMTQGEIAAACGFYDSSHFGLRFREAFGITPSSFRADSFED